MDGESVVKDLLWKLHAAIVAGSSCDLVELWRNVQHGAVTALDAAS